MTYSHILEKDWITQSGLRAVVVKQGEPLNHRCGYVEVTEESGLFGLEYNEIDHHVCVHGGITFSGVLPFFKDCYWFGYDCAHSCDMSYANPAGIERTLEFCVKECESLSKQLSDSPLALFYLWKKSGKLASEQHNRMLAFGIRDPQNPLVRQYLEINH